MVKVLFHIGVGKTGTTSIQENIFNKHSKICCKGRPNHNNEEYNRFYFALTREEDNKKASRIIHDFISKAKEEADRNNAKIIVISDETLCGSPLDSVVANRFAEAVPDATILITIRNQFTALPSYYSGHGRILKDVPLPYNGSAVSFDNWFNYASDNFENSYFRPLGYYSLFKIYSQSFPSENIHILTFEDFINNKKKFASDLGALLDVDISKVEEKLSEKNQNPRSSGMRVAYQHFRSNFLHNSSLTSLIPGGAFLRKSFNNFLDSGKPNKVILSEKQKAKIVDSFAVENAKLAKEKNLSLAELGYPIINID